MISGLLLGEGGESMRNRRQQRYVFWLCLIALSLLATADAQIADQVPDQLRDVGVIEHLDSELPMDLVFRDENGQPVRLGDFFDGQRPVILSLNYYRCPMLCGLQLNGLVTGFKDLEWTPGQEFEVVTVSIDPLETPALAREKKQNYLKRYGRPSAGSGWHFLTGDEPDIRALADAVGFGYTLDKTTGEYAHAAVTYVVTPDGRLARYLYGIEYPAKTLRMAMVEAADGEIGTSLDQLILYCFHYDPSTRRYAPVAMNIMRVGGGGAALILVSFLAIFWIRDTRKKKNQLKRKMTA